jgi:hypothetical protein
VQLGKPLHSTEHLPLDKTTGRPRIDAEAVLCESGHADVFGTSTLAATGAAATLYHAAGGRGGGSGHSVASAGIGAPPSLAEKLSQRDTVRTILGLTGNEGTYTTQYRQAHVFTDEVGVGVGVLVVD